MDEQGGEPESSSLSVFLQFFFSVEAPICTVYVQQYVVLYNILTSIVKDILPALHLIPSESVPHLLLMVLFFKFCGMLAIN